MSASDDLAAQMAKLQPDSRARVERALKDTIAKELAQEPGRAGGPGGPAGWFSRGVLFSKSGKSISLDEAVLPALPEMDEAKFKTFMDRIAQMRGSKVSGSAGGGG